MIYLLWAKPFVTRTKNTLEIINEHTITFIGYCLITFSDMVALNEFKYQLGWAVIGMLFVNFIINTIVICSQMFNAIRVFLIALISS